MATKKKPLLYLIYSDLTAAVKATGMEVFEGRRPKTAMSEKTHFATVELTTGLRGTVKGPIDVKAQCYGTVSVFCKAKEDGTLNMKMHTALVQSVTDLFPINGAHVTASQPRVLVDGEDGYGFQVTVISFLVKTKFNARNISTTD